MSKVLDLYRALCGFRQYNSLFYKWEQYIAAVHRAESGQKLARFEMSRPMCVASKYSTLGLLNRLFLVFQK